MSVITYSEITMFCIIILCMVLFRSVNGSNREKSWRSFSVVIASAALFILSDLAWGLIEGGYIPAPISVNYLINAIYYILSGVVSVLWYKYAENIILAGKPRARWRVIAGYVPFAFLVVLVLASCKTGWLFYIDETNHYHRGDYHFLQMIVAYGYVIYTSAHALIVGLKKENYVKRKQYVNLASFAIAPLVFGTLQAVHEGSLMLCFGITLGVLQVYMTNQEQMISIDPLTQLNNRTQMVRVVSAKMARSGERGDLYLLMMDVNEFKLINDRYGHVEGDRALVRVADVLREVAARRDYFISRYGGDEFLLTCEVKDEAEVKEICDRIHMKLREGSVRDKTPYKLSVSIGYAKYTPDIKYIPELIALADKALYEMKARHKKGAA